MLRPWMLPLAILATIMTLRAAGVADHLVVPFACGFAAGFWLVCRRVLAQRQHTPMPSTTQPPAPHAAVCPRCGKRKPAG